MGWRGEPLPGCSQFLFTRVVHLAVEGKWLRMLCLPLPQAERAELSHSTLTLPMLINMSRKEKTEKPSKTSEPIFYLKKTS